jgi:DNA-binding transcriptional regulator GbsR (MarR family)
VKTGPERPSPKNGATPREPLPPDEAEVIDLCLRIAQYLGLPKSVGEIYGLLFVTPQPLNLDDLTERLNISQGSASQGLRLLRTLGAVKPHYVPGDRRDFYSPETGLGRLAEGFMKARVIPGLDDLHERLETLDSKLSQSSGEQKDFLKKRMGKLQSWQKQAASLAPLLSKIMKAV